MTNTNYTVIALSKNAADELAKFSDTSIAVTDIKVANTQDIGEVIGATGMITARVAQWCRKHLKGFPHDVKDADRDAIIAGLIKHKCALDAANGREIGSVVKIGEDRYMPHAEWLAGPGKVAEDKPETVNVSGPAIMALSSKKVAKMEKGKGTLHSFIAPRKKAIQTYASNRYNAFVAYAIRMEQAEVDEATLAKGKELSKDSRPVISRDVKLAKVFWAALRDAEDGDFPVAKEVLSDACNAFWKAIGIEAPALDAKGNVIEATPAAPAKKTGTND